MSNTAVIVKNTLFLYIRMFITLAISLYTSRLVLQMLGVVDYGIYNVVGGIVTFVAFFQSTLSNVNLRFFCIELGAGNLNKVQLWFRFSITAYTALLLICIFFLEVVGLYFIQNVLTIPGDRLAAANIVFQCSLVSFTVSILCVPSNALIISHERMSAFAFVGVAQSFMRLFLILYVLYCYSGDKLSLYACLEMILSLSVLSFYIIYCRQNFKEVSYKPYFNKKMLREITPYVSWNLVGCGVWALNSQGINLLLNVFFSSIINASRGIAFQVNQLVNNFMTNLYAAFRPQITKSFAAKDWGSYHLLIYSSIRYLYLLSLLFSIPLIFNIDYILAIWLGEVPEMAAVFSIWALIFSMINSFNEPLWTAVQASGSINKYQFYSNVIWVLSFPISWLMLYCGYASYWPMILLAIFRLISLVVSYIACSHQVKLDFHTFFNEVLYILLRVTILSVFIIGTMHYLADSFVPQLLLVVLSTILNMLIVFSVGLKNREKRRIYKIIKYKLR